MATKYATLKDSNGDTIYPQISTDSITNNSVTSAKIDWSTIQDVSFTKNHANISWYAGTYCKRFGNIVMVNLNIETNGTINGSDLMFSGLPAPSKTVTFGINGSDAKAYRATINTSGQMHADGIIASGVWYDAQVFYFM